MRGSTIPWNMCSRNFRILESMHGMLPRMWNSVRHGLLPLTFACCLIPASAAALTCAPETLEEQLAKVATVFAGTVRSVESSTAEDRPENEYVVTLDVDTIYTGEITPEQRVFVSEDWGPSMVEGTRYLVYGIDLDRDDGILVASACGSTGEFDQAERGHLPEPLWTADQQQGFPEPRQGGALRGLRAVGIGVVFGIVAVCLTVLRRRS